MTRFHSAVLASLCAMGCGGRESATFAKTTNESDGGRSGNGGDTQSPASGGHPVASGGYSSPPTGGRLATGGVATGGMATGGMATGGMATGGMATGGASVVPLWRNSTKPFCSVTTGSMMAADVWSDSRGVFLLGSSDSGPAQIFTNLGEGWTTTFTWPEKESAWWLAGFDNGPLVSSGRRCAIEFISGSSVTCSGAPADAVGVAVVNARLAYSAYKDRLLKFDGTYWTQLGAPLEPAGETYARALWADDSIVVVAAASGRVYLVKPDGNATIVTGLPEVDFTAVWGFGPTDIWIGSLEGHLYHYDGSRWSLQWVATGECQTIRKLWGSGGKLFVLTRSLLALWDGSKAQTIAALECGDTAQFLGLWGNSASEVFVALEDNVNTSPGCGPFQVRWFDGMGLHSL